MSKKFIYLIFVLFVPTFIVIADGLAPDKPTIYIYEPFAWNAELGEQNAWIDSATLAATGQWQMENRSFIQLDHPPNPDPPWDFRVPQFKNQLQQSYFKIVWIATHGSVEDWLGYIAIEPHSTQQRAENAFWNYIGQGLSVG